MSTDSDNILNLLSREEHSAEAESQYDAPVTTSTEEPAHTDHTDGTTQRRVTRVTRIGPIRTSHHGSGRPGAQRPGRPRPYPASAHRHRGSNSRRFRREQPTWRTVHDYDDDAGPEFYDPTDGRYQLPDWQGSEQPAQHLVPVRPPPPPPRRVVVQPVAAAPQQPMVPRHPAILSAMPVWRRIHEAHAQQLLFEGTLANASQLQQTARNEGRDEHAARLQVLMRSADDSAQQVQAHLLDTLR